MISEFVKIATRTRRHRCAGKDCGHVFRGGDFALMVDNGRGGFFCVDVPGASSCATEGAPGDLAAIERLQLAGDKPSELVESEAERAIEHMGTLAENGRRWVHYQKHTLNRRERDLRIPTPYQAELDRQAEEAKKAEKSDRKGKAA